MDTLGTNFSLILMSVFVPLPVYVSRKHQDCPKSAPGEMCNNCRVNSFLLAKLGYKNINKKNVICNTSWLLKLYEVIVLKFESYWPNFCGQEVLHKLLCTKIHASKNFLYNHHIFTYVFCCKKIYRKKFRKIS